MLRVLVNFYIRSNFMFNEAKGSHVFNCSMWRTLCRCKRAVEVPLDVEVPSREAKSRDTQCRALVVRVY